MKNDFDNVRDNAAACVQEMRHVMRTVLSEVTASEVTASEVTLDDVETLIIQLLSHGVTRHEIAFLISEALPLQARSL